MTDRYFDRLWSEHVIASLDEGVDLMHVDRHLIHDIHGAIAFSSLEASGRKVCHPELTWAVADHLVSTKPGRVGATVAGGNALIDAMEIHTGRSGVRMFGPQDPGHGIVHIVSAEQGIALPGLSVLCCDSHACTVGALGTLSWGIGTSETEHVLATQTIRAEKPGLIRVEFIGKRPKVIGAKDMILSLLRHIGSGGGRGFALEYDGEALRDLSVEERMTLCNMAMEAGSEIAIIRPDEATFDYVRGRPYAPVGEHWDGALAFWRKLADGCELTGDQEIQIDVSKLSPQITWGTMPTQVVGLDEMLPDPEALEDPRLQTQTRRALDYMGLKSGGTLAGLPINHVFIGSCTNARIGDLRSAAQQVKGRKVASSVRAIVVPGSRHIREQAEAEGLHEVFLSAGFEWHEAGCSMCAAINGDLVQPSERCISTSNRNFEGRQGLHARTHLAGPELAAASAIAGYITSPWRP